jgi:tripartite-type tricarboxylate transporter receptor subunit TctC
MLRKIMGLLPIISLLSVLLSNNVLAEERYYEGKTMRIIVGLSAGGGFDIYARTIARHMGKHIPGNPTIIVENMPGAGGLTFANYLYKVVKPDGLTIGTFHGNVLLSQLFGQKGYNFKSEEFEYIGVPGKEDMVAVLTKRSGISNIDQWINAKTPVKLGGFAPGSGSDNVIRILREAMGLPIQLVSGYKGSPEIRLAAESGELDGFCFGWDSVKAIWNDALKAGDAHIVLQAVPDPLPDLPNVPLAINFAKTEEAREMIEVGIHAPRIIAKSYLLPPGTPKNLVQILRKAFDDTMNDKEFAADLAKTRLGLSPVSGDELEKTVVGLFKRDPAFLAKLKDILFK